jgi:allantoin racemase
MRLLLANSNTTPAITATIVAAARAAALPGTEVVGATGRFGAAVVGTRSEAAIAAHALVDMLAEHAPACDAVLIGMSLDTGLWAARELVAVPVLGMTEAACLVACTLAPRFGMVVLGTRGLAPYREVVESYGLASRLAGLRALPATPQDLLREPAAVHGPIAAAARDLVEQDGAEAVVLVGAVMAGLPPLLQPQVPVPLVEGITAGVALAEALARLGYPKPAAGSLQPTGPRATVGLAAALTARLAGRA